MTIFNRDGKLLADSREVAEMVEKDHRHLLRDIGGYCAALEKVAEPKIGLSDFFIEATYKDPTGRTLPCYYITKKGCDMIANKLTGAKGVIFTAKYVTRFDEMEKQLSAPQLPQDYIGALKALVASEEEKQALKLETSQQKQLIGELQPKANYVDSILKNPGLVTITQIAKDYGMSGAEMNKLLHKLGIQYKESDQWLLYRKHQAQGYTHSRTVEITHGDGSPGVKMNTAWTQKGRLFLYETLKNYGVLPMIERK